MIRGFIASGLVFAARRCEREVTDLEATATGRWVIPGTHEAEQVRLALKLAGVYRDAATSLRLSAIRVMLRAP